MDTPKKPAPVINPWAKPFWEAARKEQLVYQDLKELVVH